MYTEDMEQSVMVLCLKDKDFLSNVYDKLSPNHFSTNPYKWIFWAAKEYYKKYGDAPNEKIINNELVKSSKVTPNRKLMIKKILTDLYKETPKSVAYTTDEMNSYIKSISFINCLETVAEQVEKGDHEKARKLMMNELLGSQTDKNYKIVNWLKEFEKRQAERKNRKLNPGKYGGVPIPYKCVHPWVDNLQQGEIGSVTALTSSGKSIMLGEFGADAMLGGFNVVHFVLENTDWQATQRYDSRILGVPYDVLKRYSLTKKQKKQLEKNINALRSIIGEKLMVVKCPQQGTDVIMLEKILRELEVVNGFYAQLIVLDYADIMSPATKMESFRLGQAGIYWDIKAIAEDRNIPLWTATQAPQEFGKKNNKGNVPILRAESAGESYWKSRILDIMFTLYQTEKQKFQGNVTLHIAKNRDGPRGAEFVFKQDFANMRFIEM